MSGGQTAGGFSRRGGQSSIQTAHLYRWRLRRWGQNQSSPSLLEEHHGRDYSKITSALKLRFGDAHLAELLQGPLHNRTQQAKEDLTTFAYEVQSLAKRAFVNSPIETQEFVAARQFVEGIGNRSCRKSYANDKETKKTMK
nr:unnamed protein product [Callosobruchus chinensis]